MINRKRGRLEDIIRAISQRNDTSHSYDNIDEATAHNAASGKEMLENLRKLLRFWQGHYLHKDKDCTQLEKSSRIPFDYWKSTVELLTDDNVHNTSSLLHYINTS